MKNLVFVLLVLAACVVGLGVYRGWFSVNRQKLQQDENTVKKEIHDLEQKVKDKSSELTSPAKERK